MQTIVITGSTRGIGYGLAYNFLKNGHQVSINGQSENSVKTALNNLSEYSTQTLGVFGDVSSPEFIEELFYKTVTHFGKVDIWINNAGITTPYKQTWEIDNEIIKKLISVNIYAMIQGTLIAYRHMHDQGHGKIFNLEGLGSDGRIINKMTTYGTSKRAVNYFTKSFSKEIRKSDVQVGVIQPGMVLTDLILEPIKESNDEELKQFKKVFNILGEKTEIVTPWICSKILKSNKKYTRIKYTSIWKIFRNIITRRKILNT